MIINRHNYEEFFLLYVDNELALAERAAVESFVRQNPDLAEEMEMLKQAILNDESIEFKQKGILYQRSEGISLNNYEEHFLLSIDNELTSAENEQVEKFILKHPELQNEFLLLEKARLQPENIVFTAKDKLYKKAGKERRLVLLEWMKISAAAAIAGFVALTWVFTANTNKQLPLGKAVATGNKSVKAAPIKIRKSVKLAETEEPVAVAHENAPAKIESQTRAKTFKIKPITTRSKEVATNTLKSQVNKVDDNEKKPIESFVQKNSSANDAVALTKTLNKNNLPSIAEGEVTTTFTKAQTREGDESIMKHALYHEIDNQEDENEKSFYIGSAEINKNKLKGLFKKAASLFEKKNNKNDGERTLKIAGFEIKGN